MIDSRLGQRVVPLVLGLALFGVGVALLVRSNLGLDPWDVLHQGLSIRTGASLGTVTILSAAAVMLAWIPLRQRPGAGTLANVVLVGVFIDLSLWVLPEPDLLAVRIGALAGGIGCIATATALYVGAGLGPGPRDGLMTGLAARGWSIRWARTAIEITVLAVGWLLGGTVGVGTVVYALSIGPLVHRLMPIFAMRAERV